MLALSHPLFERFKITFGEVVALGDDALVYTAGREQVTTVWVAGKVVVHERQLAGQQAVLRLGEVVART